MENDTEQQFGVSPEDIVNQSSEVGQYNPQVYATRPVRTFNNQTDNPYSAITGIFSGGRASAQSQGQSGPVGQSSTLYAQDADFYANQLGDIGAAAALVQSKEGKAVFKMFEPRVFNLGNDNNGQKVGDVTFHVVPYGKSTVPTQNGPITVDNWALARHRKVGGMSVPVSSVPFKGGDEKAIKFRDMMDNSSIVLKQLAELEQIYTDNPFILTNIGPSEASTRAKSLETSIMMNYSKIMYDSKAMGQGVSDKELEFVEAVTPHRASYTFSRLGGNEMALLKKVRQQILDKVKTVANDNGIDLIPSNTSVRKTLVKNSQSASAKEIQ